MLILELLTFHLRSKGKSKIDSLFFNPSDALTPLIYVNANLFNNYELFDPGVMRNIHRQSKYYNKLIGFIRINTENKNLNFNSDRTRFLQNELSDEIIKFLKDINMKIQIVGSEMKKYLVDFDFLTNDPLPSNASNASPEEIRPYIKTDFFFRDQVTINNDGNHVTFSLFGRDKQVEIKKPLNNSQKSNGNNKNNQNHSDTQENTSQSSKANSEDSKKNGPIPEQKSSSKKSK